MQVLLLMILYTHSTRNTSHAMHLLCIIADVLNHPTDMHHNVLSAFPDMHLEESSNTRGNTRLLFDVRTSVGQLSIDSSRLQPVQLLASQTHPEVALPNMSLTPSQQINLEMALFPFLFPHAKVCHLLTIFFHGASITLHICFICSAPIKATEIRIITLLEITCVIE